MRTLLRSRNLLAGIITLAFAGVTSGSELIQFNVRSAKSGNWSQPGTWDGGRVPEAGDNVQVRPGHRVIYDLESDEALRTLHVGGILSFSREVSTRLDACLIKIEPGEETTLDGFNCHDAVAVKAGLKGSAEPALEIGTPARPLPPEVTARIRLVLLDGMDPKTMPALVNCGGRWDVHGAPMNRTWVKLGEPARPGDTELMLAEDVTGWRAGDRVIVTASKQSYGSRTFRKRGSEPAGQTEERVIARIEGKRLFFDQPLEYEHFGQSETRSEVANLSRNVVIESADPQGVRGHTMYHRDSSGGISYAEFRHLGKEGELGKYPIHFHLVRDTMRGSGVTGASIWDSHNRWITIHGTDYLLVRDCVGYQSVGHGFFLEDATEQYNVLDRNLAVQAYGGKRLPGQVLKFDPNDGAGFWWANGRNTLIRNVACENDEYGFRFEIARRSNFDPVLNVRGPDGVKEERDIRTIPFFRFEDNESHTEGLYSFNFGDDANPGVRGDREHPFVVRNLRAWETHYALRPNVQFFLLDGFTVNGAAYGVYHPDYDAHVYRNIRLNRVEAEPINRGHDDESIQHGSFTYENVLIENCRVGRDPLIQLACTAPRPGQAGHFRGMTIRNSQSRNAKVVDLGGGPRNAKLQHPVAYYFYDYPEPRTTLKVTSARFPEAQEPDYQSVPEFTGPDVMAKKVTGVDFPVLLEPIDDLPPATLVTSINREGNRWRIRGVSHDNVEVAQVTVNNRPATVRSAHAGVVDWEIVIAEPLGDKVEAWAVDRAGNTERQAASLLVNAPLRRPQMLGKLVR